MRSSPLSHWPIVDHLLEAQSRPVDGICTGKFHVRITLSLFSWKIRCFSHSGPVFSGASSQQELRAVLLFRWAGGLLNVCIPPLSMVFIHFEHLPGPVGVGVCILGRCCIRQWDAKMNKWFTSVRVSWTQMAFLIHSNSECLFCVGLCAGADNGNTGVLKSVQSQRERDMNRWLKYKVITMVTQKPWAWND